MGRRGPVTIEAKRSRMYIRFVISTNDPVSGRRQGIFQALSDLEYEGMLLPHEQLLHDELYEWFCKNLRKPRSFSRSSRAHAKDVALSWFKDSAHEHIAKMHALCSILSSQGVLCELIRTDRPGYIVYEDDFQVAAEPFYETVT